MCSARSATFITAVFLFDSSDLSEFEEEGLLDAEPLYQDTLSVDTFFRIGERLGEELHKLDQSFWGRYFLLGSDNLWTGRE